MFNMSGYLIHWLFGTSNYSSISSEISGIWLSLIEIWDACVEPLNILEFLLSVNSSFFNGLLFLSSDLFIAVTPLPPILNLFENLLLLFLLNYGICLLEVNLPFSIAFCCYFFFLTILLSGVTIRLFSFTTSLIVFRIVEKRYFEFTIEFQFCDAKKQKFKNVVKGWDKSDLNLLMLKTIRSRLSKNGMISLWAFSFQSILIYSFVVIDLVFVTIRYFSSSAFFLYRDVFLDRNSLIDIFIFNF